MATYEIILKRSAITDMDALRKFHATRVADALERHLLHDPTKESKSRIKICRGRSALDGSFYCAVSLPSAIDAGPPGVHVVRIRGPRKIDYSTEFLLTP